MQAAFRKPELCDVIEVDGTLDTALAIIAEIGLRGVPDHHEYRPAIDQDSGTVQIEQLQGPKAYSPGKLVGVAAEGDWVAFTGYRKREVVFVPKGAQGLWIEYTGEDYLSAHGCLIDRRADR